MKLEYNIELRIITEKTAAGIRAMEKEPDFLLYDYRDKRFTMETILNIPLLQGLIPHVEDCDCPLIPIWLSKTLIRDNDILTLTALFQNEYTDYNPKIKDVKNETRITKR